MRLWTDQEKLKILIEAVVSSKQSSFYRDKYQNSNFFETGALEDLPFLTRADLVATHPKDRCYVDETDIAFVAHTSGTTSGQPLISYFSEVENYYIDVSWGTGVKRPLIVFPPLNKTFGSTFIQQCRQSKTPCTPLFGSLDNLAVSAYLANEVNSDALYATPTLAMALAPYIRKHYDLGAIKLLVISGETIGAAKLASLKRLYSNALVANLYASSEIGQFIMGPTLPMMQDEISAFKPLEDVLVALEIIDGELVVTYCLNKAFPLIRYRTGDQFIYNEGLTKKYGDGLPVLEWAGKGGVDVVRVHGMEIRTGSVDDFFASLPQMVDEYQLHIYPAKSDIVRLELEVVGVSSEAASLIQESFIDKFQLGSGVVKDAIARDLVENVAVNVVRELSHQGTKRRVLVNHV